MTRIPASENPTTPATPTPSSLSWSVIVGHMRGWTALRTLGAPALAVPLAGAGVISGWWVLAALLPMAGEFALLWRRETRLDLQEANRHGEATLQETNQHAERMCFLAFMGASSPLDHAAVAAALWPTPPPPARDSPVAAHPPGSAAGRTRGGGQRGSPSR